MIDINIISEKYKNLNLIAEKKKNEYLNASPFPNIDLDNFFDNDFLKKVVKNSFRLNGFNVFVGIIEIYGIFSSVFCLKSFYRPRRTNEKI